MTPHTQHTAYTARAAAELSHVTDRLTDTANIGKNSQHLMHSMQPKKMAVSFSNVNVSKVTTSQHNIIRVMKMYISIK